MKVPTQEELAAKVQTQVDSLTSLDLFVLFYRPDNDELFETRLQAVLDDVETATKDERAAARAVEIIVEKQERVGNNTRIEGTCGPKVTLEMIKQEFEHPYAGSREARICNGRFSIIRYND